MYRKHVTLLFFKFFDHIMITINATVQVPNSQCVKVTCELLECDSGFKQADCSTPAGVVKDIPCGSLFTPVHIRELATTPENNDSFKGHQINKSVC